MVTLIVLRVALALTILRLVDSHRDTTTTSSHQVTPYPHNLNVKPSAIEKPKESTWYQQLLLNDVISY